MAQYSKQDLQVLKNNPQLLGARTKVHKIIQESQQDSIAKQAVECFI